MQTTRDLMYKIDHVYDDFRTQQEQDEIDDHKLIVNITRQQYAVFCAALNKFNLSKTVTPDSNPHVTHLQYICQHVIRGGVSEDLLKFYLFMCNKVEVMKFTCPADEKILYSKNCDVLQTVYFALCQSSIYETEFAYIQHVSRAFSRAALEIAIRKYSGVEIDHAILDVETFYIFLRISKIVDKKSLMELENAIFY